MADLTDREIDSLGTETLPDEPEPPAPAEKPEAPASGAPADEAKPAAAVDEDPDEIKPLPGKPGDPNYTKAVEKRIGKMRAKLGAVERERDRYKEEALNRAPAAPAAAAPEPAKAASDLEPTAEQFTTTEEYVKALASWQYRADRATEVAEAVKQRAAGDLERTIDQFKTRVDQSKIREQHPDFDAVVDAQGHYSPTMKQLVLESDRGPELAYYLATHEAESVTLSKLDPVNAAKAMGKLEERLSRKPEKRTVTNAAEPLAPVGGDDSVGKSPDAMSQAEYEAWRNRKTVPA